MEIGRETTDLDFLLTRMNAEEKELQKTFEDIISMDSIDCLCFSFESIKLLNQPHMDYPGYRITLKTEMHDKVQIDIGIGDIVEPLTHEIPLIQHLDTPFFEKSISLLVYPPEAIFSEKLETILSKGPHNTRMKDYHDLILLLRNRKILNIDKLKIVMTNTFSHRGTIISPIEFSEASLKSIQKLWAAHLRDLGDNARTLDLPKDISIIMEEINQYVLSGQKISLSSLLAEV